MLKKKRKVVVAISGGVDSSVAAYLLREQGFEVIGLYMRLFGSQERSEMAARKVCASLGIKFYPVNISYVFKKEIINYFIDSYKNGLTPNPCVKCNKIIKFGELFKVARGLGGCFATGHYARITEESFDNNKSVYRLWRGLDKNKDQTYFLYNLTQKELKRLTFPIGEYEKKEIRGIADSNNLPYLKKDSQDICFLHKDGKEIEHNEFLKKYIKIKPGPIKLFNPSALRASPLRKERKYQKDTCSKDGIIGEHKGLPFYTIGQRRGI
ncbi:tRNA 2-thiouridine(34) synthase MnmA, partial [bacterium]|nr:tRNA 2-thiouridine(34) synthase MnmA [bacterium]